MQDLKLKLKNSRKNLPLLRVSQAKFAGMHLNQMDNRDVAWIHHALKNYLALIQKPTLTKDLKPLLIGTTSTLLEFEIDICFRNNLAYQVS